MKIKTTKDYRQFRRYCITLSDEEKRDLYNQILEEAKEMGSEELKQLYILAAAVEETANKKLLKHFYSEDNPFNRIATMDFFERLHERLVLMMVGEHLKELNQLDELLPRMYERLKQRVGERCIKKAYGFSNFLRDNMSIFKLLKEADNGSIERKKKAAIEIIRLFILQPKPYYPGEIFMLHLILQNIKVLGEKVEKLISDINILIYLLDKNVRERLEDIEAKKELMDKRAEVVEQLYQLSGGKNLKGSSYKETLKSMFLS